MCASFCSRFCCRCVFLDFECCSASRVLASASPWNALIAEASGVEEIKNCLPHTPQSSRCWESTYRDFNLALQWGQQNESVESHVGFLEKSPVTIL